MASTLTIKTTPYGSGRYLQLDCVQTKDIATNTSTIKWTLTSAGGTSNYFSTGPTTVKINGTQVYYKDRVYYKEGYSLPFPGAKGSVSGTLSIKHDDDGKKTIPVSLSTAIYTSTVSTYKKDDWELDSIPRKATITSAPNFTDLDNPTIKYSNLAGTAVTSLQACIALADNTVIVDYGSELSKTGDSYPFNLSDANRDALRKAFTGSSGTVYFHLRSVIGGIKYWDISSPCTLTIRETENTKPTVTMNVTLNNGSLPSKFAGLYIQNKSRVDVTLSAQGKYNASIRSLYAQIDGQRYAYSNSKITSNVITSDGEVDLEGWAEDSRGFHGIDTETVTVISYSKPIITTLSNENAILCYRSDANGVRVRNSTSLWLKAKRIYSSVNGKNECPLEYRYKLSNAENFSNSWTRLTLTENEYNAVIPDVKFEANNSYAVQIRAMDDMGEYDIKTFDIPTADVCFHLKRKGNGAAFGEYATEDYALKLSNEWVADGLYGLGKCLQLPEEADVNNYLDFRIYGVSAENAKTIVNIPEVSAGILKVYSADGSGKTIGEGGYIMQEFITTTRNRHSRLVYPSADQSRWIYSGWKTIYAN